MSDAKHDLERIRAALEAADRHLVEALDARAKAVLELAQVRAKTEGAYSVAPNDDEVVEKLVEKSHGFAKPALRSIVKEVLSASANLVGPVEVAYAGQEGGFGHLAARAHFGASATHKPVESAEAMLQAIARGRVAFGVLPFETSHDGAVTQTLNLLARSDVKICAEVPIRRSFHLLSRAGEPRQVKTICATPSALVAAERYLARAFPDVTLVDTRTHMAAAERAAQDTETAALGTSVLAELAGLPILEHTVEDVPDLDTRYVVVGNALPPRSGRDCTSVVVALHDGPGVLIDCLRPFAERKINLSRLETRPARGWEFRYLILVEVDGHITDRPTLAAVEELRSEGRYVKVLGSYPRART